uniref:Uncharacterized protein n=1 Tax=Cryptophlebia leucotreta granulosis virus TaxID=35254 RepID=A0A2H4ZKI8_GVCL|nr:hypothetical protein [Cryptophlebia leucotreta granulovirus]
MVYNQAAHHQWGFTSSFDYGRIKFFIDIHFIAYIRRHSIIQLFGGIKRNLVVVESDYILGLK